ncbi:MAG: hypothetical protein KDC47_07020, partial [Flavobacteriaceae bacterium]|nr:hypothetical protein [Flavobacteriaceae bacterium]
IEDKFSGTAPIYSSEGVSLYAIKDSDAAQRNAFIDNVQKGQLHFIHHTTVVLDRANFIEQMRSKNPDLKFGPGYHGRHQLDVEVGHPYRELASFLVGGANFDHNARFEDLWRWLEEKDPIENLLADQLDYLHAVMATGKTPEKVGTALGKAITSAEKQQTIDELVSALGSKPYETSHYATFTALRDLILDLKEPTKTA